MGACRHRTRCDRTSIGVGTGAAKRGPARPAALYAGLVHLSEAEFDDLVADALDEIPAPLAALMDNVVVLVEEEPRPEENGVLGLYVGTPLTERDSGYTFRPPDQVFVYRGPLLRMCRDVEELAEEVAVTVVHEIAHHFGIDDDELHEWGLG
jgi:predicted Zn-dependent protease with MMP-like domain